MMNTMLSVSVLHSAPPALYDRMHLSLLIFPKTQNTFNPIIRAGHLSSIAGFTRTDARTYRAFRQTHISAMRGFVPCALCCPTTLITL